MELFIAKRMQVYKDLLDVGYTLDEGEVRVNFRKVISSQFLEIFDSITDHVLPLTLEGCYEKARFAAEVIKARKPTLSRVPNHSAQVAETKTQVPKAGDKGGKLSGKKSTGSQPQGRRVVHSSRSHVQPRSTLSVLLRFSQPRI